MVHSTRPRTLASAPAGVGILVLAAALGACRELPHHPGRKVQVLEQGDLSTRNPADVAVAPVIVDDPATEVPQRILREVFADALVRRRYSPLAIDYVDSRTIDAAYTPGAVGEDAVCEIVVHSWDERKWSTGYVISFDVEMRLVDAGQAEGSPGRVLWSAHYPGLVDATPQSNQKTEAALYRWACAQVALELAGALPPRDTSPGSE